MHKKLKTTTILTVFTILVSLTFFRTPVSASANLYISPSSGSYYQGNNFTLGIYVSSDQAINAVELNLSYDSSKLSIVSCGAVTSTFTMIADGSCPSITVGTTGSYSGGGAQVAYVTFRANSLGTANVSVSGKTAMSGSSVSTSGTTRSYGIVQYNPVADAPKVTSASHPDSDEWYKERKVELSWNKDAGVTNFSYEFDQKANTSPNDSSDSTGTGVDISAESDGLWYFHLKAKSAGGWSSTIHFKVKIDSIAPVFTTDPHFEDKGDLRPDIYFEAEDEGSGLGYYEVIVDEGEAVEAESPYKSSILTVGDHEVTIRAYDKADNFVEKILTVTVESLQPPQITELIVERLFWGAVEQRLIVRGTAPPGATIYIQISSDQIQGEVLVDAEGNWEYIYEELLTEGDHELRVMTEIEGMQSEYSEAYAFSIGGEGMFSFLPKTGKENLSIILFFTGGLVFGAVVTVIILLYLAYRKGYLKRDKKVLDSYVS